MKKKILALSLCVAMLAIAIVGGTLAYFTDTTDEVENTFTMGKVKIDLDETKVTVDAEGSMTVGTDKVKTNDYSIASIVPGRVFSKDPTIHVEAGSEEAYIFLDMTFNKSSQLIWVMAADASADSSIDFTIFNNDGTLNNSFVNGGKFSASQALKAMLGNKPAFQATVNKWFTGIVHEKWELCDVLFDGNKVTFRFAYKGDTTENIYTVNTKNTGILDIKFMDSFQMPSSVTQEMIENGTAVGGMTNNFNTTGSNFELTFTAYAIQAAEIGVGAANDAAKMAAAYKAMFNNADMGTFFTP